MGLGTLPPNQEGGIKMAPRRSGNNSPEWQGLIVALLLTGLSAFAIYSNYSIIAGGKVGDIEFYLDAKPNQ